MQRPIDAYGRLLETLLFGWPMARVVRVGLKLRAIPDPISVAWVQALGAYPTPMPFPAVDGGLESKAIAANLERRKKNGLSVTPFAPAEVARLREKMTPGFAEFSACVGEPTAHATMTALAMPR
ncbi:MAG: hypothetical protein ABIX46_08015 [Burkholderiaceae bacterium]